MIIHQMRFRPRGLPTWPRLLALFAGGCILLSLFSLYANNFGTLLFTMLVGPLACCAAGLVSFGTELPRQHEFRLLMGILAMLFLSSALSEKFYGAFLENRNDLFALVTLLFVCYALCFALPEERRLGSLNGLIDVSCAVVSIVALVGVILATCGVYARPAFLPEYGIGICPEGVVMGADGRLTLFTHPNSAGMICEVTLLLNLYRILTSRRRLVQWLHGVSAIVCYLAVALAASRTATIALSVGLALYAFRLAFQRLAEKNRVGCARRWAYALVLAVGTLAVAFLLNGLVCDLLLSIAPSNATSAASATAAERNLFEDMGMFTGRTNIWSGALQAMRDTPRLFLIGASPIRVGQAVSGYTPIYAQELHNSFMQVLLSGGVLSLLLFVAFLVLLCVHSVRLYASMRAPGRGDCAREGQALAPVPPDGRGWLPVPLAAILVNACMESFLLVYPRLVFAGIWFFILSGYVVCMAKRTGRALQK